MLKVAESAIKAVTLINFTECIKTVGILLQESPE
jgi:hypothetical protein